MIRITVELFPWGSEKYKTKIGQIDIINDGSGTKNTGNYNIKLYRKGSNSTITKTGKIYNFPRLRKNIYELLYLGLKEIYASNNSTSTME